MLKTLQVGRGLAALAVVSIHLTTIMALPKYGGHAVFQRWTAHGARGVDFFFVLSGFIILFAHQQDIGDARKWPGYAYKRFARLYPIYWVYTGVFVLALMAGLGEPPPRFSGADWLTTASLVRFTTVTTPLPQAWTLFHEILFYVIFSVLILSRRLGLGLIAVWAASVAAAFFFHLADYSFTQTLLSGDNLNFFIGMGAYLAHKRMAAGSGCVSAVLGVGLLAVALAWSDLWAPGLAQVVWGCAFGLLVAGAAAIERNGQRMEVPLLATLGNASYSIYLVHSIAISAALKVFVFTQVAPALSPELMYVLIYPIAVMGGCIAYAMFEKPLLRRMRNAFAGPKRIDAPETIGAGMPRQVRPEI